MDALDLLLRAVGAFYVFAGFIATRAAMTGRLLDVAIAALGGGMPSPAETLRYRWHVASAANVLLGGVTLLLLARLSLWLFLASAAGQALYLLWVAPRFIDPYDEPDAKGRGQTRNAFIVYLLATALVVWASSAGRLASLAELSWPVLVAGAVIVLLYCADVAKHYAGRPNAEPPPSGFECDDPELRAQSKRIKLMPEAGSYPLWAVDEGLYGNIAPADLGLSDELARDLATLSDAYQGFIAEGEGTPRWSDAEKQAYGEQERSIARRLARELPDRTIVIADPVDGLVEIGAD